VLPEGGTLFHAKNGSHYEAMAAQHAVSWYKSIRKQIDVPNGSLWLVTGCMKSKSWGIAAFSRPDDLCFIPSWWSNGYYWQPAKPEVARGGPTSKDLPKGLTNQCTFIQGYRIMLREDVHDSNFKPRIGVPSEEGRTSNVIREQLHQTLNPGIHNQSSMDPSSGQSVQGSSYMKSDTEFEVCLWQSGSYLSSADY